MDRVFQEEQKKLSEIETKIDSIASRYEAKATDLEAEISDYYCVDYEDVQRKQELVSARAYAVRLAKEFRDYQVSPYFGRLDLDSEETDESATYYIGKEGISDSANIIVVDWRTPIGSCYYASNQKKFHVNGTDYLLALRRALDIKNGVLVSYRTEYDGETVALEGDVIDPFLLTVLKDKRRHNRLTDIIRTIQGNQNEIIRKPRGESFVVQGCAGSGKTMILLHRLSFLKFNNRNMSLSGVKIITPNKFFDAHINDLSVELGLTAIERYSVEEYYVSLIKRYSSKIVASADVQSEKTLNVDMLADIYSLQYMSDVIFQYHEYWKRALGDIDEAHLRGCFDEFKIPYPDTAVHTLDTLSRLEQGIDQIVAIISTFEKKRDSVLTRLSAIDEEIISIQGEYDRARSNTESTKDQTKSRINAEIDALSEKVQEHESHMSSLHSQNDDLVKQKKQFDVTFEQYDAILRMFSHGVDAYSEYDSFEQQSDDRIAFVRTECATTIAAISEAQDLYEKTPIYNFGKRNSLRKKIAEAKEKFSIEATQVIFQKIRETQAKIEPLRIAINEMDKEIADVEDAINAENKEAHITRSRITALQECSMLLSSMDLPDMRADLLPASYKECAPILSAYEEQRGIAGRILRRLNSIKQIKHSLENEKIELIKAEYSTEEKEYIDKCKKNVNRLQFSEITRNVMFQGLLAKYRQYNQKYRKTNYRHKLYLKLLYCALYFPRPLNQDNFLNIDEAQDISDAEYRLLRMVLGDKCVFNLYGDINQSVYSYKGISDWEEISNITSGNIYVLNENYRNTLQITDFCNKEFGAEVYPIGISGEPVLETDTVTAVKWLFELKKENPEFRVAIIHRHGLKAVQDNLRSILVENDISWYSVDDAKVSVLSVETAKGLEFEAVVAIVDQMSSNERYIAYTRALDYLAVVRDKYAPELEADNSTEEIDDEFIVVDGESSDHSENGTLPIEPDIPAVPLQTAEHPTGQFYSWEILNETTAVKTCDPSFFEYNGSGVPKEISWFFDTGSMQPGECKPISIFWEERCFAGKVEYSAAKSNRMRVFWNADLGECLRQYIGDDVRAVFSKINDASYRISIIKTNDDAIALLEPQEGCSNQSKISVGAGFRLIPETSMYSTEECALLAEFDAILEDRFGPNHRLSSAQQKIIVELFRGKSVACNAPSGSMKSVMLYLLALKEHQTSGKQTLLTAEAHLQENELVLADKLGLKGGIISTMDEFQADFKKEKYDVIFVPYVFFEQHQNIGPFIDYFSDRVSFWGLDHPSSEPSLWMQINNCGTALNAVMFLMEKMDFSKLDLSNYQRIDIAREINMGVVKKHTLFSTEEKLKWLLENLDELDGQGIVYCDDEMTCKTLSKHLRKAKIMAEAYIDVANPDKKESINYLTNAFSNGGVPVLVTTQNAGKNLSNPSIRFIIHYDMPADQELYQLHVSQIGQLAIDAVVHDLYIV